MTLVQSLRSRPYENKHAIRQRDKAIREGRTLIDTGITMEMTRAAQNQGRWPAGSVWLWSTEEVWSPAAK